MRQLQQLAAAAAAAGRADVVSPTRADNPSDAGRLTTEL